MKRFMIVGALALLAGGQAFAADLPPPAPMPRAPAVYVPAPIPVYTWTGFYIGGNLGVGWQQGNLGDNLGNTFSTSNSVKGLGGGQVGVNYEFYNGVVVGAEAMFDWRFNNNNTSNATLVVPAGAPGRYYRQQSMADHGDRQTRLRLGPRDALRQGRWRLGGIEQSNVCPKWRVSNGFDEQQQLGLDGRRRR